VSSGSGPGPGAAFELELEQHRSLRAEVIQSMQDSNQIMTFGLPALGLIVSGGLAARDAVLGFFLLTLLAPAVSVLTLSLWCAAQQRMARASHFLTGVEKRLKALAGSGAPTWEAWLRPRPGDSAHQHIWSPEATALALFYGVAATSVVLGTLTDSGLPVVLRVVCVGVVVVVLVPVTVDLRRRFKQVRKDLTTHFQP